ncbi:DUF433 domain-containing protein [Kribbella sp. NPDC000426]|uniref:DUF433 domain-containing protein n=1 Tax=Kribbella sp. NPDC000426 TaxID=3154255 RepID=UPI003329147B
MDPRFDLPILTRAETATHLDLSPSTLGYWVKTKALHVIERERPGDASITFASLVETHMLRQLRQSGLSLRAIRDAAIRLRTELGREYPLAWRRIAHDGRDVLAEIAAEGEDSSWERIRDRQGGLPGVVELGLESIEWAPDDYAERLRLTAYRGADVMVDPQVSFGQPILAGAGVRVEDVVDLARAGEPYQVIADEFGIQTAEVEALVRPHIRAA